VFAFHDGEEIGPRMLARIAKHTGLWPEDLEGTGRKQWGATSGRCLYPSALAQSHKSRPWTLVAPNVDRGNRQASH